MVADPPLSNCPDCGHHLNWHPERVVCSECEWFALVQCNWPSIDEMPASAHERATEALKAAEVGDLVVIE